MENLMNAGKRNAGRFAGSTMQEECVNGGYPATGTEACQGCANRKVLSGTAEGATVCCCEKVVITWVEKRKAV